jgi:hypothetical protein
MRTFILVWFIVFTIMFFFVPWEWVHNYKIIGFIASIVGLIWIILSILAIIVQGTGGYFIAGVLLTKINDINKKIVEKLENLK